jgi:hypothetical protein
LAWIVACHGISRLELVSLTELRSRLANSGIEHRDSKVSVVTGDVREMHQAAEYAGAVFQVASQFNLLEMASQDVTPEQGVTCYQSDHTQGPACAMAAGAATIYRNYFAPEMSAGSRRAPAALKPIACAGSPRPGDWTTGWLGRTGVAKNKYADRRG